MKGLMVTLLLLTWTGMVVAQQANDNGFRAPSGLSGGTAGGSDSRPIVPIVTDGGASSQTPATGSNTRERTRSAFSTEGRPATERRTATEGRFTGGPSTERSGTSNLLDPGQTIRDSFHARTTGADSFSGSRSPFANSTSTQRTAGRSTGQPMYLGLPIQALNILRTEGNVEARIPDATVNRITISDKNAPKAGEIEKINAVLDRDTLVFQMSSAQLAKINDFSYVFDVPEQYKGKFTSARIEYPDAPPQRRNSSRTSVVSDRGSSSFEAAGNTRWRLPDNPLNTIRPPALLDRGNTTNLDSEYQRELELRQKELAREKYLRDQETYEKQQAERKAQLLADDLARIRAQQQYEVQTRQNQYPPQVNQYPPQLNQYPPQVQYPPQRYADNTYLPGQTVTPVVPAGNYQPYSQPRQNTDSNTLVLLQMQNEISRMSDRVAQVTNDNKILERQIQDQDARTRSGDSYRDRFGIGRDQYRNDLARSSASSIGNRATEADPPNIGRRTVMSTGGSMSDIRSYQSGNGALKGDYDTFDLGDRENRGDRDNRRGNRDEKRAANDGGARPAEYTLLWLMLLCSVGLNLYLWFLSRTFYSRYQELADELRETFTATV